MEYNGLKIKKIGTTGITFLHGDLIFFDWQNDNDPDHIGIVERVDNNTVYTIEGNSKNECKELSYPIKSDVILGYGINQ